MGTQGKKNTPITARVNAGLFNQKKGVTEPLLNVGPAGVHGDNQTRDIPSPSKMRGYTMKASPFKREDDTDPKVGVNVLTSESTGDQIVKGAEKTRIKTAADVGVSQEKVNAYNMATYGTLNPTKEGKANNTMGTGEFEDDTVIPGTTTETKEFTPNRIRDKGDAQTSLERRNTIRSGKIAARTAKDAQRKEDRDARRAGTTKDSKKEQRLARNAAQNTYNKKISKNVMKGVENQSAQNIAPGSARDVMSDERNMGLSDVGSKELQDKVIKEEGFQVGTTIKNLKPIAGEVKTQGRKKVEIVNNLQPEKVKTAKYGAEDTNIESLAKMKKGYAMRKPLYK